MLKRFTDSQTGITWTDRPGDGAVVVFLHGIGSNASSFDDLLAALPAPLRGLAWNAPGYGGSAPLAPDWPVARDYADALRATLDSLGLDRVILVGHSLGTLIASAFAAASPARVHQLILAASACGYAIAPGSALPDKVAARITDLQSLGPREFAATRAPRLIHDPQANPALVAQVTRAMSEIDPAGYAQAVHMLASGDLEASLRGVTCRTDFIIGAEDVITPRDQTNRAARAYRAGSGRSPTIIKIDGAGHAVYLQQPDAFTTALTGLIDRRHLPHPATGDEAEIGGHHG